MTLAADALSFRINNRVVFDGVDLSVGPGETLAITGPSGSGKTTMLRQLALLDPLQSGGVTLSQQSPSEIGIAQWRRRVVYVAQDVPNFEASPKATWQHLRKFAVHQHQPTHTDPLAIASNWNIDSDIWSKAWQHLSGGERQRIYLAIACATSPDVLLLDEPTSHIDPDVTRLVEATLKSFSCVWVTHDPSQAARVATQTLDLVTP